MSGLRAYAATIVLAAAAAFATGSSYAAVGLDRLPNAATEDGPVTVLYPTAAPEGDVQRGPFKFRLAERGEPQRGNGHLVVLSHGSGGSPWPLIGLATRLVDAGYVVAIPEHRNDDWRSTRDAGPAAWKRRPGEVSHAIDTVTQHPRFAALVKHDEVGVWGMSAGGHTALTVAGGAWSPAILWRHCQAHLDDDFTTCTGPALELTGGWLDGFKKALVRLVQRFRLDDDQRYTHTDPRIAAVVAEVPFAADFDMASLAQPRVPLGLVVAGRDAWLTPRYHAEQVLAACTTCERVVDNPEAGHASFLSPPVPGLEGYIAKLLGDPPGYDRARGVPEAQERIVAFFQRHLPAR